MTDRHTPARRRFLRQIAGLAAAGTLPALASPAHANLLPAGRSLSMLHTHTGEQINLVFAVGTQYVSDALGALNHFLRDHYSGTVGVMDPNLFDLLHAVKQTLGVGASAMFEVISGYRCPTTNAFLKKTRGGGVATHSLHMEGQAIDVRLPGVPLAELRDAALSLQAGGVGYYPSEQFVHIDTGRVRTW